VIVEVAVNVTFFFIFSWYATFVLMAWYLKPKY